MRFVVSQSPFGVSFQDKTAPCRINGCCKETADESSVRIKCWNNTISKVIKCILPGRGIILAEGSKDLIVCLVAEVFNLNYS